MCTLRRVFFTLTVEMYAHTHIHIHILHYLYIYEVAYILHMHNVSISSLESVIRYRVRCSASDKKKRMLRSFNVQYKLTIYSIIYLLFVKPLTRAY